MTSGTFLGIVILTGLVALYLKVANYFYEARREELAALQGVAPEDVAVEDVGVDVDGAVEPGIDLGD